MTNEFQELQGLLRAARPLPPVQRLIVMLYATCEQDGDGTVWQTGLDLARVLDITPQQFSAARLKLVRAGWLEETNRDGNMRYYRLTEKADIDPPESNVFHLSAAS